MDTSTMIQINQYSFILCTSFAILNIIFALGKLFCIPKIYYAWDNVWELEHFTDVLKVLFSIFSCLLIFAVMWPNEIFDNFIFNTSYSNDKFITYNIISSFVLLSILLYIPFNKIHNFFYNINIENKR